MLKTVGNPSIRSGDQTILNGNLVIGTSGKGIDFSANSHASGMTSELFDDYEEGTWTPGGAGANATGWYTKIGEIVIAYCELKNNSLSITGISGLPFAAGAGDSAIGAFFGRARFAGIFDGVGNEFRIRLLGSEIRFMTNGGLAGDANATVTTAAGGIVQLAITAIYKV
jgi:hypothetical protein